MTDQAKGGLTVEIGRDDIQHLMTHGAAVVTKEVGPIEVKIRCDEKMTAWVVVVDEDGEHAEVLE
jgi:hypothetical protein